MERNLKRDYKLYIKKLAREYRIFGTINHELLDAINKILLAIRNNDFLEEIRNQAYNLDLDLNDNITYYTRLKSTKIEF